MEKQTRKATRRALYSKKSWGRGGKKKGYKPYASRCERRAGARLAKDQTMRDQEEDVRPPEPQLQVVEPAGPTRIEQLREIVTEHQALEIDGHLVDATTASVMCKIHDALNEANREKFMGLSLLKMVDVGWKLIS